MHFDLPGKIVGPWVQSGVNATLSLRVTFVTCFLLVFHLHLVCRCHGYFPKGSEATDDLERANHLALKAAESMREQRMKNAHLAAATVSNSLAMSSWAEEEMTASPRPTLKCPKGNSTPPTPDSLPYSTPPAYPSSAGNSPLIGQHREAGDPFTRVSLIFAAAAAARLFWMLA